MKVEVYQSESIAPSELDLEIAQKRMRTLNKDKTPRVGDFVIMPDGNYERFSHKWNDGLQTTDGKFGESFYLGDGYVSFSGGLNPVVPNEKLELTTKTREGRFWIFHDDYWGAGRAVGVKAPCRVYKVNP